MAVANIVKESPLLFRDKPTSLMKDIIPGGVLTSFPALAIFFVVGAGLAYHFNRNPQLFDKSVDMTDKATPLKNIWETLAVGLVVGLMAYTCSFLVNRELGAVGATVALGMITESAIHYALKNRANKKPAPKGK